MKISRSSTTATRSALLLVTMLVFASARAGAAVSTWVAAGTTSNFSDSLNWNAVPTPDCDLVFPAGAAFAAKGAPVNDLTGLAVNAINIYEAYTISGNAVSCKVINDNNATSATVALPLSTAGGAVMTVTVTTLGATLHLSGLISGAGPMTYGGPGTTRLDGTVNNTLSGVSTVTMGTLALASTATEAIAGPLIINSGATATLVAAPEIKNTMTVTVNGTFDLATATGTDVGTDTETIGGLNGTGTITLGAHSLGCTAQISTTTFSGGFSGSGGFRQSSSGTQFLSGTSTNTGVTTLAGGSIHLLGSQTASPVTVTAGTLVLANDCLVGDVVVSGGSSSALTLNDSTLNLHGTASSLTIGSGSAFQIVTKGAGATQYSNVSTAAVTITGAALVVNTATYTPAVASVMTIIDNTGGSAVTGTFAGLAQGATVVSATNTGTTFTISYTGGTGNDVTLTGVTIATDITPPVISAVASGALTASSATITWTTNEASDSQVEYGLTGAYGNTTTLDPTLATSHSVVVAGLTGSSLYHYRVLSKDAAGNLATGADGTFTTAAGAGTTGGSTTGTATAGTATAGTTGGNTTHSSNDTSCGLGGGLALLMALGFFANRRKG